MSKTPPSSTGLLKSLIAGVEGAVSADGLQKSTEALAHTLTRLAKVDSHGSGLGDPEVQDVIECLLQVLGFNNPGAAVAAVDGLIALGPAAVGPLLANLDAHNYGARAWAVRALAGIGDTRGLDVLEDALATDVGPSVRRAAARGLGTLRLETLAEEQRQQVRERCLGALESGRPDGEWVVRYAVAVGLEGLALPLPPGHPNSDRAEASLAQLLDPELEDTLVVRLRAGVALKRLNAR